MSKYGFEVHAAFDEGRISGDGAVTANDEEEAIDLILEEVRQNISVERVEQEYSVVITLSFTFTDSDGDYEDESAVQSAVESGDIDFTSESYDIDEVSVDEV